MQADWPATHRQRAANGFGTNHFGRRSTDCLFSTMRVAVSSLSRSVGTTVSAW
jgi:hypothetical protein